MNHQVKSIILRKMWVISILLPLFLAGGVYLLMIDKGDLVLAMQDLHSSQNDQIAWWLNLIGDGWTFGVVILLMLFINFRAFFLLGFTGLASTITVNVMKRLIWDDLQRPKAYFENMDIVLREVEGITISSHFSFPSGHTVTAFAMMVSLILLNRNKLLGLLFLAMAIAAGLTRVYLGQHFYFDVYFGALIGVLIPFIIYVLLLNSHWYRKRWLRKSVLTVFRKSH